VGAPTTLERIAPTKPMKKRMTDAGYETASTGETNEIQQEETNSAQDTTRGWRIGMNNAR
jgi:hypothetical protein